MLNGGHTGHWESTLHGSQIEIPEAGELLIEMSRLTNIIILYYIILYYIILYYIILNYIYIYISICNLFRTLSIV